MFFVQFYIKSPTNLYIRSKNVVGILRPSEKTNIFSLERRNSVSRKIPCRKRAGDGISSVFFGQCAEQLRHVGAGKLCFALPSLDQTHGGEHGKAFV